MQNEKRSEETVSTLSRRERATMIVDARAKVQEWTRFVQEAWIFWEPKCEWWKAVKLSMEHPDPQNVNEHHIELLEKAIETEGANAKWSNDIDMALGMILILNYQQFDALFDKYGLIMDTWVQEPTKKEQATRRRQLRERMKTSLLLNNPTTYHRKETPREEKANDVDEMDVSDPATLQITEQTPTRSKTK